MSIATNPKMTKSISIIIFSYPHYDSKIELNSHYPNVGSFERVKREMMGVLKLLLYSIFSHNPLTLNLKRSPLRVDFDI